MRSLLSVAVASAAMIGASSAQAQTYGGYPPPPAYANSAYDYARGGYGGERGFTLAGARAGVTVLGIDIDAGAALRIGAHHEAYAHTSAPDRYAPRPYESQAYAPTYEPQAYAPMTYAPAYPEPEAYPVASSAGPCGCEPAYPQAGGSRYGW